LKLFTPFTLKGIALKNRVIKSATLENMATLEGLPTDKTRLFYERLAQGGTGLIITGYAYVNKTGQSFPLQSGIHRDRAVPEWRRITDRVHELGSKIAMQIAHGGRQIKAVALGGRKSVAPSATPDLVYFTMPKPMTEAEILQTILDFRDAAARVKEAGFDAVQIHGAHGYLISSFLSPMTNRRRDAWGGDFERRFRFLREVYTAVRKAVGADFGVFYKLNVSDLVPFGTTPSDSFPAARRLAELGLDAVEISGGINEMALGMMRGDSFADIIARDRTFSAKMYFKLVLGAEKLFLPFREAYFLPYAEKLRPVLNIPLILVGGVRSPETAERIIESGSADFISMARPLLREPGLPNRWSRGDLKPAQCVSCNRCLGETEQGNKLRCYYVKET
jgi:2,4-dienoyl-CoA reductase-like NADH-dependent reductase (Old Yellow Enzyme family)